MNTMEITKVVAGLCAALLVLLLVNTAANSIFGLGEGGHGGEVHHAYTIEVPEAGDTEEEVVEAPVDIMPMMAAADAAAGEKLFKPCAACHSLEAGQNKAGPSLHGVVGRDVATEGGFNYSSAMSGHGGSWTEQSLSEFLTAPKAYVPGTKMNFKGYPKPEDRANLIAYLASNG